MKYILLILIGILIGIFGTKFSEKHEIKKGISYLWSVRVVILWLTYLIILGFIVQQNWNLLMNPSPMKDLAAVKSQLGNNKGNLILLNWAVFFGLAGLVAIIVKLPFMSWETLKFWGFEGKRLVQETKDSAREELLRQIQIDQARTSSILEMSSEEMYTDFSLSISPNGTINGENVIQMFLNVYTSTIRDYLGIIINAGAIEVNNNGLLNIDLLPDHIQKVVKHSYSQNGLSKEVDEGGHSIRVYRMALNASPAHPYYLVYLHSNSYLFGANDFFVIQYIENMIKQFTNRLELEISLQQGAYDLA
ncbi:hypothetical protein ACSBO6_05355 [Bacillus sp. AL-1R]